MMRNFNSFASRSVIDYHRRGEDPVAPPLPGSDDEASLEGDMIEDTSGGNTFTDSLGDPLAFLNETITIGGQTIPISWILGGFVGIVVLAMVMKVKI